MLAGFGFSSLKMQFPDSTPLLLQIVYLGVTASAVGLELCAILNAACCSVFGKLKRYKIIGPGKFLRGQGGLKAAE